MVQQSPRGTPSRRTPARGASGAAPKPKQVWTKCPSCELKTMSQHHECEVVGPCVGPGVVRLTPIFKDTVYCHLHPDTMKEIGIKIGCFAKICNEVLECWPDPATPLDHVGYSTQERQLVSIKVIEDIKPALQIMATIEGNINRTYLPFVLQNRVIYCGQQISIPYFSRNISVTINTASSTSNSQDSNKVNSLSGEFSNVSLTDSYYQILPTTVFLEKGSLVKLPQIIGAGDLMTRVQGILDKSLKRPDTFGSMGPPQTLLISGPSGSGKTLLAKTILQSNEEYRCLTISDFNKVTTVEDHVKLVLLDGLDSVKDDDSDKISRVFSIVNSLPTNTFVLATASHLPPSLLKVFPIQLQMPPVTSDIRLQIFESFLSDIETDVSAEDLKTVSLKANGYVGADICNVCRQAVLLAEDGRLNITHMLTALTRVPPRSMNDIKIEVPEIRWTDIGGLHEVQELLTRVISWPIIHHVRYREMGISPPKGLLLYGPPGCCKTMMAKALATESGLNFLSVKGPELLSMYVGESERAIRDLFSRARAAAPAIIFFDEIDALACHRGAEKGSGVHDRVLAQLLTELDGVEGLTGVVVIAATNRPDRIDKALLRPGRLEKLVYIPLPDYQCRLEILKLKFKKIPHSLDLGLEYWAEATGGFSGAEVVALCHNAAIESISCDHVSDDLLKNLIDLIVPQTSGQSLKLYDDFSKNKL